MPHDMDEETLYRAFDRALRNHSERERRERERGERERHEERDREHRANRDAENDSGSCGCFMTGVLLLIFLILIIGWFTGWLETWWNWLSPMIDGLLIGE